ncbi:MAG: hypothetical protein K2I33_01885, partial [Oscillospiraceae bacterium]|nr:hypothetical protein [Oscillospiraceae bacterium]
AQIVSRVERGDGSVVYENDGNPHEAVDPETAYVMNHLLQEVIKSGTGTAAQLSNKTVAGKTGTTDDWNDLCFVGLTEDFVSGIWIGYDEKNELNHGLSSAQVWYNIIGEYANSIESDNKYPSCDSVIEAPMCSSTGLIAGPYCSSNKTGYWKSSNAPTCANHASAPKKDESKDNEDESSEDSESSESSESSQNESSAEDSINSESSSDNNSQDESPAE